MNDLVSMAHGSIKLLVKSLKFSIEACLQPLDQVRPVNSHYATKPHIYGIFPVIMCHGD